MTTDNQTPAPTPVFPEIQIAESSLWDIVFLALHDPDPAVRAAAQVLQDAAHIRRFVPRK